MSTAYSINDEAQDLFRSLKNPAKWRSHIAEATHEINRAAFLIENHWSSLSEEAKLAIAEVVYQWLGDEVKPGTVLQQIWFVLTHLNLAWEVLTILRSGRQSELAAYFAAMDRLISLVLDSIERDNPQYQADLQDALDALEEAKAQGTVSWETLKSELNLWNPESSLREEQQKL